MKSLGLDVSDTEIEDMLNEVDADGSGAIDLQGRSLLSLSPKESRHRHVVVVL